MLQNTIFLRLSDILQLIQNLFYSINHKSKVICYCIYVNISVDSVGIYVDDLIHQELLQTFQNYQKFLSKIFISLEKKKNSHKDFKNRLAYLLHQVLLNIPILQRDCHRNHHPMFFQCQHLSIQLPEKTKLSVNTKNVAI